MPTGRGQATLKDILDMRDWMDHRMGQTETRIMDCLDDHEGRIRCLESQDRRSGQIAAIVTSVISALWFGAQKLFRL